MLVALTQGKCKCLLHLLYDIYGYMNIILSRALIMTVHIQLPGVDMKKCNVNISALNQIQELKA